MNSPKNWKTFTKFELHHQVIFFISLMVLTIFFTRIFVFFYNPNPTIAHFELHHFDYGLLLLMITILSMLFGKLKTTYSLILSSLSFGLIIDDLWFIRSNIIDPATNEVEIYSHTFSSVVILIVFVLLCIFIIKSVAANANQKKVFLNKNKK